MNANNGVEGADGAPNCPPSYSRVVTSMQYGTLKL